MDIRQVIITINRMLVEGVIDRYAIGGAVAATFYLLQFIEAGALEGTDFSEIIARYGLVDAWEKFRRQFLGDAP